MDRLPLVIALAVLASACGGQANGDAAPAKATSRARVNAVAADPEQQDKLEEWCEVYADAGAAKTFAMPALADGVQVPASKKWRWVNVWATWCKPCIEELPMLARWSTKLPGDGADLEMVFLSVDDDAPTVTGFREKHPQSPEGPRIEDVDALPTWLSSIGLDESSVLPIHLFVDPQQKLRCVRMGGVGEGDYDTVKRVLKLGSA